MEAVPRVPMLHFSLKQSQHKSSFGRLKQVSCALQFIAFFLRFNDHVLLTLCIKDTDFFSLLADDQTLFA